MREFDIVVRSLRAEDIHRPDQVDLGYVRGVTCEIEGCIAGYAGVNWALGRLWGFMSVFDERVRRSFLVHRTAIGFLQTMDALEGEAIFAIEEVSRGRAKDWMSRLGFNKTNETFGDVLNEYGSIIHHSLDPSWPIWRRDPWHPYS